MDKTQVLLFDIEKMKSDLNIIKEKCIEPVLEKGLNFLDIQEIILSLDRLNNFIENTNILQKILVESIKEK